MTTCMECGSQDIKVTRYSGGKTLQCLECGWERDYPTYVAM